MIGRVIIGPFILVAQVAPIPAPVSKHASHAKGLEAVGIVHFCFDPAGNDQFP